MRLFLSLAILCALPAAVHPILAQQQAPRLTAYLPDAPSQILLASANPPAEAISSSSSLDSGPLDPDLASPFSYSFYPSNSEPQTNGQDAAAKAAKDSDKPKVSPLQRVELDADGNPIPLSHQQPQRILGFMPNFRSVGGGAKPPPPGWKYNFKIATHQALDYSSFLFLGLTSISAEGINSHPVLGKGIGGFYAYTWRGLLDKTDGTYIGAWFLPSLLHEDTRYYAIGSGQHGIAYRALYIISRQGVTRTYGGRQTPNIAGLGGKVLTQLVSRQYYPTGATSFGVLATKFGYSAMRDVAFTSIREFYPDIAAHYIRKHREKIAARSAQDVQQSGVVPAAPL